MYILFLEVKNINRMMENDALKGGYISQSTHDSGRECYKAGQKEKCRKRGEGEKQEHPIGRVGK